LRIKEQGTRLTLHEHDDDEDEVGSHCTVHNSNNCTAAFDGGLYRMVPKTSKKHVKYEYEYIYAFKKYGCR